MYESLKCERCGNSGLCIVRQYLLDRDVAKHVVNILAPTMIFPYDQPIPDVQEKPEWGRRTDVLARCQCPAGLKVSVAYPPLYKFVEVEQELFAEEWR